jgi:hypothetical protein
MPELLHPFNSKTPPKNIIGSHGNKGDSVRTNREGMWDTMTSPKLWIRIGRQTFGTGVKDYLGVIQLHKTLQMTGILHFIQV